MPDVANKFILIAMTQEEARVWATGLEKGTHPEKISALSDKARHHHVRQAQHHKGHSGDPEEKSYFEAIASAVASASEILLLGHGSGKANSMVKFIQFLERKHPNIAHKVVGAIDSNLHSMSEAEILAEARKWFDNHHHAS